MENKFTCSSCGKSFDIKERGYFSNSQGNLCIKCWEKIRKEQEKNKRKYQMIEEREFENKVKKIIQNGENKKQRYN